MKNDVIYRQAAIDALMEILDRPNHAEFLYTDEVCKALNELQSAQPEQDAEFWRKRAEEYRNQCIALTVDMMKGIKFDSMCFNEDGLVFKRGQPEQRWIPVSERLPENRDWVLGIFQEVDTGWINPIPFVCDYVGKKTPITTQDNWLLKLVDEPHPYYERLHCIAWMPLPEPY